MYEYIYYSADMLKSRVLELNASDDRGIQVYTICIAYMHMYVHVFTYICTYKHVYIIIYNCIHQTCIYMHVCTYRL